MPSHGLQITRRNLSRILLLGLLGGLSSGCGSSEDDTRSAKSWRLDIENRRRALARVQNGWNGLPKNMSSLSRRSGTKRKY